MSTVVSVVIPCYRQAQTLGRAIESVTEQSYPDTEIIVVNDGSDDDTDRIASRFGKDIVYVEQENRGLPSARNTGIDHASGRYLIFLDADDLLGKLSIESLLSAAANSSQHIVRMGYRTFNDEAELQTARDVVPDQTEELLPGLFSVNRLPCHAYLCPRDAAVNVGRFDEALRACEDWDLWLRLGLHGLKARDISYCGAYYRRYQGSMSSNLGRMLDARTRMLLKASDTLFPDANLLHEWGDPMSAALCDVLRRRFAQRADRTATKCVARAIAALRRAGFGTKRRGLRSVIDRVLGSNYERLVLESYRFRRPQIYRAYCRRFA